eukprot:1475028-Pyramimonas_sp.AAC.1
MTRVLAIARLVWRFLRNNDPIRNKSNVSGYPLQCWSEMLAYASLLLEKLQSAFVTTIGESLTQIRCTNPIEEGYRPPPRGPLRGSSRSRPLASRAPSMMESATSLGNKLM